MKEFINETQLFDFLLKQFKINNWSNYRLKEFAKLFFKTNCTLSAFIQYLMEKPKRSASYFRGMIYSFKKINFLLYEKTISEYQLNLSVFQTRVNQKKITKPVLTEEERKNFLDFCLKHIDKNLCFMVGYLFVGLNFFGKRVNELLNLQVKNFFYFDKHSQLQQKNITHFSFETSKGNLAVEYPISLIQNELQQLKKFILIQEFEEDDYIFVNFKIFNKRKNGKSCFNFSDSTQRRYFGNIFIQTIRNFNLYFNSTIITKIFYTTHSIRRGRINNLLENGFDAFAVQNWIGHKSVNSTLLYEQEKAKSIRIHNVNNYCIENNGV